MSRPLLIHDVLNQLEDWPRTADEVAGRLLAPPSTIASILNRAVERGHAVQFQAPAGQAPRYGLSERERQARRRRLKRTAIHTTIHRQGLARMAVGGVR